MNGARATRLLPTPARLRRGPLTEPRTNKRRLRINKILAGSRGSAPGLLSVLMAQKDTPTRFSMPGVRVFSQSVLFCPTGVLIWSGA